MSRRAIRRLQGELQKEVPRSVDEEASEEDVEGNKPSVGMSKPAKNPFELLGDLEDEEEEEEGGGQLHLEDDALAERSAKEDEKKPLEAKLMFESERTPGEKTTLNGTKKKKRRAKKSRKQKDSSPAIDGHEVTALDDADVAWSDEDEPEFKKQLDQLMTQIEELAGIIGSKDDTSEMVELPQLEHSSASTLMHVDAKRLNAESEFRRLFGARMVEAQMATGVGTGRRARRHNTRAAHPILRKKLTLVNPRDNWMPNAPGLSMKLCQRESHSASTSRDGSWFEYEYSPEYARIQALYMDQVRTHDPNQLVALVQEYPFHVDSFLQLAELNREMGELDRAAEMIGRALVLLERAWHGLFKPYDGTCHLSFTHPPNRSLHVALFRHAQLLSRKGLHRTSFEVTKLLCNLDPASDPMGALLSIDSLALRSDQHQWILDVRSSYRVFPVQYLPNFALSSAFASKALKHEDASARLTEALATFPMAVAPLLQACKDDSGLQYRYPEFAEEARAEDALLLRICRIYAERAKLLWTSQYLVWFKEVASKVASSSAIKDHKSQRKKAVEALEQRAFARQVFLSDFADSGTALPADLVNEPVGLNLNRTPAPLEQIVGQFFASMLPWNGPSAIAANHGERNGAPNHQLPDENPQNDQVEED